MSTSTAYDALRERYGADDLDATPKVVTGETVTIIVEDGGIRLSANDDDLHTDEEGQSGVRYVQGRPSNIETVRDYQPAEARGVRTEPGTYQDLLRSDPIVTRAFSDIVDGLSAGSWDVQGGGAAGELVEDIVEELEPDLESLVPQVLRCWGTGFSLFEIVHRKDGSIRKVAHRRAHSVNRWLWDEDVRNLRGAELQRGDRTTYTLGDHALAIARWRPLGSDPEGQSALRPVARYIEAKRLLLQIEMVASERRGSGYIAVETEGLSEKEAETIEKAVENMLASDHPYIVLPDGAVIKLHSPQGQIPDFQSAKEYLDKMIAIAVGAEHAFVGTDATGSYALASAKNDEAHRRLSSYASVVERFFNSRTSHTPYRGIIPRMLDAMGVGAMEVPKLVWTPPAEDKDYESIKEMVQAGMITWSKEDEDQLREEVGLGEREDTEPDKAPEEESEETDGTAVVDITASLQLANGVSVDRLQEWIDSSANNMGKRLKAVSRDHRDAIVEMLEGETSRRAVMDAFERTRSHWIEQYEHAVRGELKRMVARGSASTLHELGIIDALPQVPADGDRAVRQYAMPTPEAQDVIESTARRIARHEYNVVEDYLSRQMVNEAEGDRERRRPETPSTEAMAATAGQYVSRPMQVGREQVAQRLKNAAERRGLPAQIIAEYSSVLEQGTTCDKCWKLDGTRTIVGSDRYERLSPPNQCEGGDRCRCIWTYIHPDEAGYEEVLDDIAPGWRQLELSKVQNQGHSFLKFLHSFLTS